MVASHSSQQDIHSFRVHDLMATRGALFPWDAHALVIEHIGDERGKIGYQMSQEDLAPFMEAITEAIDSQAVYWVDLHFSGPCPGETEPSRILAAIQKRQIAQSGVHSA